MKISFLIRALSTGGAERQLTQLACELARRGHEVAVISLYHGLQSHEFALRNAGVLFRCLAKKGRWDIIGFARRLRGAILNIAPDVLYSFLPTSNVLAALTLPSNSSVSLVWGVRASNVLKPSYDWLGRLINTVEHRLSALPDLVIVNSRSGLELCRAHGFPSDALRYIPNGIDETRFRFDERARTRLRLEWGVDGLVVGFAGRLDPMKGVETLIRAFAMRSGSIANAKLVIAGTGKARYVARLRDEASALGVSSRMLWLGDCSAMSDFYSAIDVLCLPSAYGEGTSNVIAEALACGCPCTATRVGDAVTLVDDNDLLAEPGDALDLLRALNAATETLATTSRDGLRSAILQKLPLAFTADETERALRDAVARRVGAVVDRTNS